ncbi:MAG: hypothetical protein DHS20C19_26070 [Acidimicrobiales bacterium]|nr:MAG: hypothetical protein DHS20C19_26070 [Acidimicrobiales bacterium]
MTDDRIELISFEHATSPTPDETEPVDRPRRSPRLQVALALLGAAAVVAGLAFLVADDDGDEAMDPASTTTTTTTTTRPPAFSQAVYRTIGPSLVLIETDIGDGGLGSGVVINAEGLVLTAHHVVDGATTIQLHFADGTVTEAAVADATPEIDIAVLSPMQQPSLVIPAVLGGGVTVGQEAYAVGHPLGLTTSLSAGVISGLDRSIPLDDERSLDGLIQFDAAVNPGNSGGPLLDRNGVVVGIVTALANVTEDASFSGIGFAVPISTAGGGLAPGQ